MMNDLELRNSRRTEGSFKQSIIVDEDPVQLIWEKFSVPIWECQKLRLAEETRPPAGPRASVSGKGKIDSHVELPHACSGVYGGVEVG